MSVIAAFPPILCALEPKDMAPSELYGQCKPMPIGEFVGALDCLYALGKVELIQEEGTLHYVD